MVKNLIMFCYENLQVTLNPPLYQPSHSLNTDLLQDTKKLLACENFSCPNFGKKQRGATRVSSYHKNFLGQV
jgi:hypothetical protein